MNLPLSLSLFLSLSLSLRPPASLVTLHPLVKIHIETKGVSGDKGVHLVINVATIVYRACGIRCVCLREIINGNMGKSSTNHAAFR